MIANFNLGEQVREGVTRRWVSANVDGRDTTAVFVWTGAEWDMVGVEIATASGARRMLYRDYTRDPKRYASTARRWRAMVINGVPTAADREGWIDLMTMIGVPPLEVMRMLQAAA